MNEDMKLLVVEDNDLDVELLERGLRKAKTPAKLTRARDGEEALHLLAADENRDDLARPFLVLLDINMPRMNGHEFLARLRANEGLKDTPVFVFTTSSSRNDIDRAYSHNANGYIVKPHGAAGLQEVLGFLHRFWRLCEHPGGPSTARA